MDYVICIDDSNCVYLTKGKVYGVDGHDGMYLTTVRDDIGRIWGFYKTRFRSVKKNKINGLLFDFSSV